MHLIMKKRFGTNLIVMPLRISGHGPAQAGFGRARLLVRVSRYCSLEICCVSAEKYDVVGDL